MIFSILKFFNHFSELLLPWIIQYGTIALFFLLALGIIALPIPDESLLVSAGILMSKGHLRIIPTFIAAIFGAWVGITGSYYLGVYFGPSILTYVFSTRIGKFLNMRVHFEKSKKWFNHFGKWALLFGYFIPGVRHFSGYMAGTLLFPYRTFSLFAYTGGAMWASLFLIFGYSMHQKGNTVLELFYYLWTKLHLLF